MRGRRHLAHADEVADVERQAEARVRHGVEERPEARHGVDEHARLRLEREADLPPVGVVAQAEAAVARRWKDPARLGGELSDVGEGSVARFRRARDRPPTRS